MYISLQAQLLKLLNLLLKTSSLALSITKTLLLSLTNLSLDLVLPARAVHDTLRLANSRESVVETSLGLLFLLEGDLLGDAEVDGGLGTDGGNNTAGWGV